ncbi:MAG: NAD(P)-binding domain-containing protein [Verrucomicrobiota bacterium]|nr:NAD(P)-binding domain-containing protein [Verrucomicrobiota bacterium]
MTLKPVTSRRTRRNVGVIGLGIIGSRVAENLRHRGFHAFVWNRTPRPVPNFVGSPGEVAELCDIVQIFVSDDDALLQMIHRMMPKLTPRHIILAHCTVAPDTMRAAAEIVERRGARLLDVPFTGSKGAAEKGQLIYYVGGEEAAIREARPVLEATSKQIVEIGAVGQASAMKIATNIITAAVVQGAAEALALVVDAGLSPEKFQEAMQANGSNSATMEMKLPKMLAGDFAPQFSVKHMLKDMNIASRLARIAGFELGVADAARRSLVAEDREGRGDADYSSILRTYFPDGLPAARASDPSNGAGDDQPVFTGLDETPRPKSAAVEESSSRPEEKKMDVGLPQDGTGTSAETSVDVAHEAADAGPIGDRERATDSEIGESPAAAESIVATEKSAPAEAKSADAESDILGERAVVPPVEEIVPVDVAEDRPAQAETAPADAANSDESSEKHAAAPPDEARIPAEEHGEPAGMFRRLFRRGSDD